MKKTILFSLLITSALSFAQNSQFEKGYSRGYKEGYCYQKSGCIEPISPVAPIPNINESYDSYKDGYNRGFLKGQLSNSSSNNSNNNYSTDGYDRAPRNRSVPNLEYPSMSSSDIEYARMMAQLELLKESKRQEASKIYIERTTPIYRDAQKTEIEADKTIKNANSLSDVKNAVEKYNGIIDYLRRNGVDMDPSYNPNVSRLHQKIFLCNIAMGNLENAYSAYKKTLKNKYDTKNNVKTFIDTAIKIGKTDYAKEFVYSEIKIYRSHYPIGESEYAKEYLKLLKKIKIILDKNKGNDADLKIAINAL